MFKFPNGHTILHTGEIFTDRALFYNLTLLPFLMLFSHCQEIQTKLLTANSSSWQIHFHKNHQIFDFLCIILVQCMYMLMMKITCKVNMHHVMCCDGSQELMFKKILNDSLMIAELNVN